MNKKRLSLVTFCFMQLFDPTHPEVPTGTRSPWRGENQKSKLGYFFIEGTPHKIKFLEHFVLFNFLIQRSSKALRACQNSTLQSIMKLDQMTP